LEKEQKQLRSTQIRAKWDVTTPWIRRSWQHYSSWRQLAYHWPQWQRWWLFT